MSENTNTLPIDTTTLAANAAPAPAPAAVKPPKPGDKEFVYHAGFVNEKNQFVGPTQAQLDENCLHDQIISSRRPATA